MISVINVLTVCYWCYSQASKMQKNGNEQRCRAPFRLGSTTCSAGCRHRFEEPEPSRTDLDSNSCSHNLHLANNLTRRNGNEQRCRAPFRLCSTTCSAGCRHRFEELELSRTDLDSNSCSHNLHLANNLTRRNGNEQRCRVPFRLCRVFD